MAVKVRVQNFQSIKDAEVVVEGLTAVTGPNNVGKSSLLRAIRGVAENTRGTSFVRYGADKCEVELTFDDGHTVKWIKGPKTKPTYIIDGGKPIYPGQGVPDEVRDLLGVHTIPAGGRDIWPQVAKQMSGQVFLLDEPGSVLAEAVANVDRVGRLNRALKATERDRRAVTSELKVRIKDRDRYEKEVRAFDGLDSVVQEIHSIETSLVQAGRVGKALKGVIALRDRVAKARDVVSSLDGVEDVSVPPAGESEDLLGEIEILEGVRVRLRKAIARVSKYDGIQDVGVDADDSTVQKLGRALDALEELRDRDARVRGKIGQLEDLLGQKAESLKDALTDVVKILGDMGECPLCGSVTDHTHEI